MIKQSSHDRYMARHAILRAYMKAVEVIDYAGLEINYWDIDFTTLTLDEGPLLDNAARPVNVMRTAEAVLNSLVELHSHA